MNFKENVISNLKLLNEYRKIKKIKSKTFEKSSFRSNFSRNNIPRVEEITEMCEDFNINIDDFLTKKMTLEIVFKER